MNHLGKVSQGFGSTLAVVLVFCASSVMAETITSPSYQINGNFGGSFGGQASSTSYKMTAIGGEAIVGNGASGSYMIDQQQVGSSAQTMQLGVQPSGLVAFFPMDENTGTTTTDASRYQNNGTFNTTAAWHSSGKIGNAVDINGAGPGGGGGEGAVLFPDSANLPSGSTMTVEAWVKQDAHAADRTIASHWYNSSDGLTDDYSWSFGTDSNDELIIYIAASQTDNGSNYVSTSTGPWNSYNAWRHVAVVYNGALTQAERVKIYIDGTSMSTNVVGSIPSSLRDAAANFSIGSEPGWNSSLNGVIDHVKLFNRALSSAEIAAEYTAQNVGIATGLTLGTLTSGSTTSLVDAIVRTNVADYSLAVQQDHDLQSGSDTIPAVSGSIGTPLTWSEGVTKGLGFTLTGAPTLDGKWNSGAKYAAVPSSATTFYDGTGHVDGTVDVVNLRLRLDIDASQPTGSYTNTLTYTGTMIP